jgi:hypothetical protein
VSEQRWKKRPSSKPLGRRAPTDDKHILRFPLGALPEAEQPTGVPVAIGVNWYSDFDRPVGDGVRWWIGRNVNALGSIRGGHCVCLRSVQKDAESWWAFYDQGREGACVGFGCSRLMSLLNRKRYYARWLWDHSKMIDEWGDTNPGDDHGTSVRAAMDVLRNMGHVRWAAGFQYDDVAKRDARAAQQAEGISANRWATSVDEVLRILDYPLATKLGAVPILNSWGKSYPRTTWMPGETLQRLLDEDGEIALITDR